MSSAFRPPMGHVFCVERRADLRGMHHGPHWRRVFGPVDPEAVWSTLASAVLTAPVVSIRPRGEHGLACGVNASLTLNARTATVRSAWYYAHDDAAPRLVTAFPTT